MNKQTFVIQNISCGHCVMSIKNELSEIEGVVSVEGSPEDKTISVQWNNPATSEAIKDKLSEINYPTVPD